ncbi:TlpA disulfide reductase family protein [Croceibacterium sp. TMG7-5b_MA50]|uniref:TlpA family protein disulfide reductase n=1 Tax=Croceibacterium sp. TMG7-5b_MA50 TaxID=3121290 RepID=UPI0032220E53
MAKLSPLPSTLRITFGFAGALLVFGTLALSGCDRPDTPEAQPAAAPAAAGTIDRSFAGRIMPAADLTFPDGATLSLATTRGQPVLLNLWATWCVPCVTEMPLLNQLAADYDGRLRVLTVSEDLQGAEKVVPFFKERDLANLPQLMDEKNDLAVAFGGGAALPLTVLYDAEGREVWRVMGGFDWDSARARSAIDAALSANGREA